MEKRPHLLRRYDLYKGCHPQRLDHFNVFAAEVQDTMDFYARLGFRLTEYAEEDGPKGASQPPGCIARAMCTIFAITNGKGPRLHHFCLLGADRDEHAAPLRRDGFQRLSEESSSAAPAATAFPMRSSFMSAIPTAIASSSTPATISPGITTTSRCAGR